MKARRLVARMVAAVGGYFWGPCPICGEMFGGQEWEDYGGHSSAIPYLDGGGGMGICRGCTLDGWGCYMRVLICGMVSHDCADSRRALTVRGESVPDEVWEQLRHLEGRP